MKCLCCNKELNNASGIELQSGWHEKCIRAFFGTKELPELDLSREALEDLANRTVNKGLTVPGVQKKLSLHLDSVEKTSRLTVVDYPAGYILKPASDDFDCLPEAEFLVMTMAREAGIKTVPNGLLRFGDSFAYITKRIDRPNGRQYAMEDFCQLSGRLSADKYKGSCENCVKIINRYTTNLGIDLSEFFIRIIFCFISGNSDMHYKNFSLIEKNPGSREFMLSAAYDLLPVNVIMPADTEETALSLNGKRKNLRKNDFLALAANAGISQSVANKLIKSVVGKSDRYTELIKESYISDSMKDSFINLVRERCELLI